MKKTIYFAAVLLAFLNCMCADPASSESEPPITESEPPITFNYEFVELTRYTSGYCYWDMKITNTSTKTITYWLITLDVYTDKPAKYRAYMYDKNLWLQPNTYYLAESIPVRETSNCTSTVQLCCIYIPYGEEIAKWEVVSTYAEGE